MNEKNQLDSGSLETLKQGETLLISARKVSGGKIHLEFAEVIEKKGQKQNILGILNASDERFSSSARRAWITAEPADASNTFEVDFGPTANWEMTEKGEMLFLNILNPAIDETRCRLQITETTEATEWQEANYDTAAKRKGKDGDFITNEGDYIYSNTTIVMSSEAPEHHYLTPDSTTLERELVDEETGEIFDENDDDLHIKGNLEGM
tara:strand:- start:63 stop:686 length:624 start_codon:yes stop_codon:yes gene_type:complete